MDHAEKILLAIHVGPLDLSLTTPVLWTFAASFLLLSLLWFASRKTTIIPKNPLQNIFEMTIEFVENQIVKPCELDLKTWTPFVLTVFLFILFNDFMGIIPGATPATSNINTTGALAVMVFIIGTTLRFKQKGSVGFFKSLIPEGVKGPIVILLFPIELVSQLLKPFSLAIRLFANMSGGHLLLLTIIGFTTLFGNIAISILSVGGAALIFLFEIFVGFIQAYVFAFLSALLIGESLTEDH